MLSGPVDASLAEDDEPASSHARRLLSVARSCMHSFSRGMYSHDVMTQAPENHVQFEKSKFLFLPIISTRLNF